MTEESYAENPPPAEATVAPAALREPAHQVSPRAVTYWRIAAVIQAVMLLGLLTTAYLLWLPHGWWGPVGLGILALAMVARAVLMPGFRYRVHRWEVTPAAIFTRSGWLAREERIAPLSRVQTVDSQQRATMRPFRLATLVVTTASAAGPVRIDCLDEDVARRVVAELTAITAASEGDAT